MNCDASGIQTLRATMIIIIACISRENPEMSRQGVEDREDYCYLSRDGENFAVPPKRVCSGMIWQNWKHWRSSMRMARTFSRILHLKSSMSWKTVLVAVDLRCGQKNLRLFGWMSWTYGALLRQSRSHLREHLASSSCEWFSKSPLSQHWKKLPFYNLLSTGYYVDMVSTQITPFCP